MVREEPQGEKGNYKEGKRETTRREREPQGRNGRNHKEIRDSKEGKELQGEREPQGRKGRNHKERKGTTRKEREEPQGEKGNHKVHMKGKGGTTRRDICSMKLQRERRGNWKGEPEGVIWK